MCLLNLAEGSGGRRVRRAGGRAGGGGGPNPPDGIGSHALGLSARHAQDVKWPSMPLATPRSRGLSGFGDNDIAASIKIHINHFTARPPFPLFVLAPRVKSLASLMPRPGRGVIFRAGQTTPAGRAGAFSQQKDKKGRLSLCIEYKGNKSHLLKATLNIHEANYLAAK